MSHHGAGLLRLSGNQELVTALKAGEDWEGLSPADRMMLTYARKLTAEVRSMRGSDIQALRESGFTDRQVLEINAAAAYMNFVNRIAEGLGVELEDPSSQFHR